MTIIAEVTKTDLAGNDLGGYTIAAFAKCDSCENPAAYLDNKGYIYCESCKIAGRGRKLRAWEKRWIAEGKRVPSYQPIPEPHADRISA